MRAMNRLLGVAAIIAAVLAVPMATAQVGNGDGVTPARIATGAAGGTGVANVGKTITLGGNLTTVGAFATILRSTAATDITLPTTGTLATTAATLAKASNLSDLASAPTARANLGGLVQYQRYDFVSPAAIAAATTVYLNGATSNASEGGAVWVAPTAGVIYEMAALCDTAPGAGKSTVATVRVNGADTAATITASGASAFGTVITGQAIAVAQYQSISLKIATGAGAASATWRGYILFKPN